MTSLEKLKNRLIDKILLSENEKMLVAIDTIFSSTLQEEKLKLNLYQLEMLALSEEDIEQGNLISEAELNEADSKWMG